MMAKFTSAGSKQVDDMQLVMVSHQNLSPFPELVAELETPVVAMVLVALMVPLGHGRLRLTTADPHEPPVIDLGFADNPVDMSRLMEGTRLAWQVASSAHIAGEVERVAGVEAATMESDERLRQYIRANVLTYCHALGTARMGIDTDRDSVVDQSCRVHGIDNLWIVDASVIPAVPRVVPNLITIALAERMAERLIH